jgi:hypothetical protein
MVIGAVLDALLIAVSLGCLWYFGGASKFLVAILLAAAGLVFMLLVFISRSASMSVIWGVFYLVATIGSIYMLFV